jgi:hypothetical protein
MMAHWGEVSTTYGSPDYSGASHGRRTACLTGRPFFFWSRLKGRPASYPPSHAPKASPQPDIRTIIAANMDWEHLLRRYWQMK